MLGSHNLYLKYKLIYNIRISIDIRISGSPGYHGISG